MRVIFITLIVFFVVIQLSAQAYVPQNSFFSREIEQYQITNNSVKISSVLPYTYSMFGKPEITDSILSFGLKQPIRASLVSRKLWYENFYIGDTDEFVLRVDPLFDFSYAHDNLKNSTYKTNTRGVGIYGNIAQKLFFESAVYENQANFPEYLSDYIHSDSVVPGQGIQRPFNKGGFDYGMASGALSYIPNKNLELALGHGKIFLGNGYRSLFLSDNSFNYPFLKISFRKNKFEYTRIMAIFMSDTIPYGPIGVREKRLGGFNILSYSPNNSITLSLLEGTVWEYPNSLKHKSLDINYLNPIILATSLNKKLNCNSIIGLGFSAKLFSTAQLYGQVALDSLSTQKLAYQVGFKYFNVFNLPNLYVQFEMNKAAVSMYNSLNKQLRYSHYAQSLAHPYGNNYREMVFISHYHINRVFIDFKTNWFEYGSKSITIQNFRKKNIKHVVYAYPFMGEGSYTAGIYMNGSVAFLINHKTNRRIELGFVNRNAKVQQYSSNDFYFYISLKTSLLNHYCDF